MAEIYLLSDEGLPDSLLALLGRVTAIIQSGAPIDVARHILKRGGGAQSRSRTWNLASLILPEEDQLEPLRKAVWEKISVGGDFTIKLSDLVVPAAALPAIASATNAVLAIQFSPDPADTTWEG